MLSLCRTSIGFFLVALCSTYIFAQNSRLASAAGDKYIISARAGGVNFIEGSVTIIHPDGRSGRLVHRDEIGIGERVATGADGKAEVLLNPGSFLRVGPSTAFDFVSTSLDNLRLNIYGGTAIFEVIAADDFRISVKTPNTEINLTRSGVYRIDVPTNGAARVSVVKGKVFVNAESELKVRAGRAATIEGDVATVAKFDRSTDDPLETWSKMRAKELAQTNAKLQRNSLRNTLLSSFNSRGWNMYNSFGLWVFDPMRRMWCFLPFGSGWGSPYGYYYGLDTWNCGLPRWVYYQPAQQVSPSSPNSSKEPSVRPIDNGDTHGRIRPPYQQIEANQGGGGEGIVNRRIGLPRDDGNWNPSYPSSGPARSIPSAPAPAEPAPVISLPRGGNKEKP